MSKIETAKTYEGKDLETIFFRPIFCGPDALSLGIKMMYNMPMPTTLQFWKRGGDILQKFSQTGWKGSNKSNKFQKTVELHRVKAEMSYSAQDYFSKIYELVTNRPDINMEDLSGTELEQAETNLFREAIAESIRVTMWLGNSSRGGNEYNTFDGFIQQIQNDATSDSDIVTSTYDHTDDDVTGESVLRKLWEDANPILRELKPEGSLVYLVTSDIYMKYEDELDDVFLDSAYLAKQNGRERLSYRGIPVIDVQVSNYATSIIDTPNSFALLTDRRNLALAVNTANFPGTEVRMWYNPDEMENRQRAVFMAGCDYLLPELISFAYSNK